jgi:hypothetical protein
VPPMPALAASQAQVWLPFWAWAAWPAWTRSGGCHSGPTAAPGSPSHRGHAQGSGCA